MERGLQSAPWNPVFAKPSALKPNAVKDWKSEGPRAFFPTQIKEMPLYPDSHRQSLTALD